MQYRRLGSTEMQISVVGLGTWQFGGEWGHDFTQSEVDSILDAAGTEGINFIDTAECYGDHLSEELVGAAIAADRGKWYVATKFGHRYKGLYDRDDLWSPEQVRTQLEDSLRALRTDYVDLYQFHSGTDEALDNDELWSMLRRQVEAGKVRHLGVSISSRADGLRDAAYQTRRARDVGAETIQVVYNRLERDPEEEILPTCLEKDLGVLARVPLASGFLTGKYRPGARFGESDVRSHKKNIDASLEEAERIRREEVPEGEDMAVWALQWCLRHPAVTAVIPGAKNPEQVRANARAGR